MEFFTTRPSPLTAPLALSSRSLGFPTNVLLRGGPPQLPRRRQQAWKPSTRTTRRPWASGSVDTSSSTTAAAAPSSPAASQLIAHLAELQESGAVQATVEESAPSVGESSSATTNPPSGDFLSSEWTLPRWRPPAVDCSTNKHFAQPQPWGAMGFNPWGRRRNSAAGGEGGRSGRGGAGAGVEGPSPLQLPLLHFAPPCMRGSFTFSRRDEQCQHISASTQSSNPADQC